MFRFDANSVRAVGLALGALLMPALAGCGEEPIPEENGSTGNGGSAGAADGNLVASGFYIDPNRSVLVRHTGVVDDSKRTQDPCLSRSSADASKKWTFGYLMSQMASGTAPNAASDFTLSWLKSWETSTTFKNDPLVEVHPDRTQNALALTTKPLATLVREAWQNKSHGSTLLMNLAPFRLLAIVNRFDLRKSPRRFLEGTSGELRFVFSVLDLNSGGGGSCGQYPALIGVDPNNPGNGFGEQGQQLVILEFAVDTSTAQAQRNWIVAWTELTSYEPGTDAFNQRLENLTQQIVAKGKGGGRPNGSALIRIRTNETPNAATWDLREFNINASTHLVVPATVKQTPRDSLNCVVTNGTCSNDLPEWMRQNGSAILNDSYILPETFPTGQGYGTTSLIGAHTTNQEANTFWQKSLSYVFRGVSRTLDPEVRHQFSKGTCSGCHSKETGSLFFHIHGRSMGMESEVSGFLGGADGHGGSDFCTSDPVTGQQRCFNELARRVDDILSYLNTGI